MRRTELLQEVRKMRFEEAYGGWQERRLTQEEAARLLGVCERTFRRYVDRYEDEGLDGLVDKRSEPKSRRTVRRSMRWCAPRRCTGSATTVGTSNTSTASTGANTPARAATPG